MAYYIFFFFSFLGFLQAGSFTTPPTLFASDASQNGVSCCYIEQENQVFYTWYQPQPGIQAQFVCYSVYDLTLNTFVVDSVEVNNSLPAAGVCCCYDSDQNRVFLTWINADTRTVDYSIYYPESKIAADAAFILKGTAKSSSDIVSCCYNKLQKKVIFCWASETDLYPSLWYEGLESQQTFEDSSLNDVLCCSGDQKLIYLSYSPLPKTKALDPSSAKIVSFDIEANSFSNLAQTKTINPSQNIFCSFDSKNKNVIISWAESMDGIFIPYYAICPTSGSASPISPQPITTGQDVFPLDGMNVSSCFNDLNSSCLFSWINGTINNESSYYAILDTKSNSFTTPATEINSSFSTPGKINNSCYIPKYNQIVLSGTGGNDLFQSRPWFAIYTFSSTPIKNSLNSAINKFSPLKLQKGI